MCKFFSLVSDGKGNIKYFDVKDIVDQMSIGNPKTFSWNSHTSICQFHGINSKAEDLWNKWEYDPENKVLTPDSRPMGVADDSPQVKEKLIKYFDGKDIGFMRNLYGRNSGSRNSGSRNSGSGNSGSGNSGSGNSGDWNSGDWNSGDWNSGDRNSGSGNSGSGNSGSGNSGSRNSGDRNSGSGNSGSRNSGDWNSGDGVLNSFCTKRHFVLFDKPCTEEEYKKVSELPWMWFDVQNWVSGGDMTAEEKEKHPYWNTTGGYLKTITYKEAWKKCPKKFIEKVKKLKGFTKAKFKEISGLDV